MDRVEVATPLAVKEIVVDENDAVIPAGADDESVTVPENPLALVKVTVELPRPPWGALNEDGLFPIQKSAPYGKIVAGMFREWTICPLVVVTLPWAVMVIV